MALGVSSAAAATAATGTEPTASAPSDKGGTTDKGGTGDKGKKGELVTQEGVVTSPVTTGGKGKGDGEVTAFKVTNDEYTLPWIATPKTIVVKNGKVVPPSAIAKGDHVMVTGIVGTAEKGTFGQAFKVVVHGDDGDGAKGDSSHNG
jgi:hypothetical protein